MEQQARGVAPALPLERPGSPNVKKLQLRMVQVTGVALLLAEVVAQEILLEHLEEAFARAGVRALRNYDAPEKLVAS